MPRMKLMTDFCHAIKILSFLIAVLQSAEKGNDLSPHSLEALRKTNVNTKRGAQTCCSLPLLGIVTLSKFLRFQETIASQRYVLSPQDSLTRLPREHLYSTKISRRRVGQVSGRPNTQTGARCRTRCAKMQIPHRLQIRCGTTTPRIFAPSKYT